jgi:UDP-2,3-diacylglucosamine hydrolase
MPSTTPQDRPVLFTSDLHLSPERPAARAAFRAFADGPAREAAAVYLLGDLFDWWIGDDQMREPFVAGIVADLRRISDAGIPLFVGHGNRDFMLGARFAQAAGATLLPEQQVLDLAGIPTLICHGDELCTDDIKYLEYRARMRDPATKTRLLRLPYIARQAIAWWIRYRSRGDKVLKADHIMNVNDAAVTDMLRAHGVQRMIHGHTHRPARHEHIVDGKTCERFVLADWHEQGQYLAVDAGGIHDRTIRG